MLSCETVASEAVSILRGFIVPILLQASDEAAGVAEAVGVEVSLQLVHQREGRRGRAPGVDQAARFGRHRVEDDVAAAVRRAGDGIAQIADVPVGARVRAAGERRVAEGVERHAGQRIGHRNRER